MEIIRGVIFGVGLLTIVVLVAIGLASVVRACLWVWESEGR